MGFNLADYEEVKDRIPRFWEKHPDGAIVTDLIEHPDAEYIVKATLINGAGQVIATGLAQETVGSSPVNRLSALENCETSAIGRALANAGFSSGANRPSREEMDKAVRADSPDGAGRDRGTSRPSSPGRLATDKQRRLLESLIEAHTVPEGCSWPLADDLTMRDASRFIDELKKLPPVVNERRSTMREDAPA